MAQFPWQKAPVVDAKEEQKKEKKDQKNPKDKGITGLRYVPWLFKDDK